LACAALVTLAVLGTGCSDDGGDTTTYNRYPTESRIALLADTNYVQYDVTVTDDPEASNVDAALQSMGHKTLAFFAIDADTVAQALQDKDVLVIPELENGDLDGAISDESRSLIGLFVARGGTLVVFGEAMTRVIDLLNNTFGFSLAEGSADEPYAYSSAGASGTPFSGGTGTLPYNDGTGGLDVITLPVDGKAVYLDDTNGDAVIAVIPFEQGRIIFLGYDWYDAAPLGTQDGGWLDMLDRAVR
jgi:hypothetical protein